MGAVSTRLNTFYNFSDLTDDHQAKHEYSCIPEEVMERVQQLFKRLILETLNMRLWKVLTTGDLPLGIPSGFARRGAGRLWGHHTSPAALWLLFGNLLDFVGAMQKRRKMEINVIPVIFKYFKKMGQITANCCK